MLGNNPGTVLFSVGGGKMMPFGTLGGVFAS